MSISHQHACRSLGLWSKMRMTHTREASGRWSTAPSAVFGKAAFERLTLGGLAQLMIFVWRIERGSRVVVRLPSTAVGQPIGGPVHSSETRAPPVSCSKGVASEVPRKGAPDVLGNAMNVDGAAALK